MGVRTSVIAGKTDSAEDFRLSWLGLWVPASQINVRTGVTSTPVLTGTGNFTCTVGPFNCVVDGTSNSLQGAYPAALDSATTVTINAASTSARIDLISLQIQDNAYDGSGQNRGQILYTAGTPGSGVPPTAPANSISLWTVPVAANATSVNFASATAVFPFTAAAGGIVPVRSASDQPAVVNGVQYRHRLDVTATSGGPSPLESSTDGTTWTPVSSPAGAYGAWTNLGIAGGFNVQQQPKYRTAPGNRIELQGAVISNSSTAPAAQVLTGLPAPSVERWMPMPCGGGYGYCYINVGATVLAVATNAVLSAPVIFGFDGLSYPL
jgi:hypothetical protein